MYYKKHPELMKLVEELYRAYRALAERYDHATGALHQAHRTMAEAFPCQFPLVMSDGSPYGSFGNEAVPHTPEVPPALRALFNPNELQKDALEKTLLENSLFCLSTELGCLRPKLKNLEESYQSLSDQHFALLAERNSLLSQVESLTQNMEKHSEKCLILKNSLSEISSKVGYLRSILKDFEESCQSLSDQNSGLLAERNSLLSQVEILTQNGEILSDKNSFLEKSLSDMNNEAGNLRSKLKESEESCQSLVEQKSDIFGTPCFLRITLLSQAAILTEDMEKLSEKNSSLENSLINAGSESKLKVSEESTESLEIAENEVSKLVKEDLEQKISTSSEALAHRNDEIRSLYEANMVLQEEINQMCEVKLLVNSKGDLISELRKEVAENECCEREITALLSDLQLSTAYAALYEEKVHELLSVGEISSILQKETLNMEVPLTKEYVDTLKKKNDDLEGENSRLKAVLDENFDAGSNLEASSKDVDDEGLAGQCMVDDEGQNFNEISRGKYGQMMKDNKLDQESSYLQYRTNCCDGPNRIDIDDQLWEASERDCSKQKWKASTAAMEHSIELIEEEKSEYPSSDLVVEKESSVDRLEMPNRALASKQEWSKGVLARLQTEFQKLLDLETDVKELKRKMETSQMGKLPASLRYNTIYPQLNDAEGAVIVLTDTNNKLTNKAEELVWAKTPKMVAAEEDGKLQNKQEGNQII
ncbi:hypothetical protein GW17_00048452 [Ensete ventricosum]|nr:hypothetical protein GW17_00048452 [Ensete ventricosum]